MKFKEGQLIQYVKYYPHPNLHLLPRLPLPLPLRLHHGDLAIVLESIKASEAWENYQELSKEEQAQIPNCYIVFWQKHNERSLVYENEIEEAK